MTKLVIPYHESTGIDAPYHEWAMSECDHIAALEMAERIDPETVIGYGCGAIYALEVAYRRPTVKHVVMINPTVLHHCTAWAEPVVCDMTVISGSVDDVAPQEEVFQRLCGHGALGWFESQSKSIKQFRCLDTGDRIEVGKRIVTAVNIVGMGHDVKGFEKDIMKWVK